MKLPIKLSRSRSTSPPSSTPPSPSATSSSSPSPSSPPKKLRFPFPHLGRSSSSKPDSACEITEVSSPKHPTSPFSRTRSLGKAKAPAAAAAAAATSDVASPSSSVRHGKSAAATSDVASPSNSVLRQDKSKVSQKAMLEIQQVFAQFDTNGDGKISAEELRAVLASLGDETTSEEAELMVNEVDVNGDGYIDLGEFVDLNAQCLRGVAEEEEMAAAFAIFDLDKNGRITAEELQEVLRRLEGGVGHRTTVEDCKRMIRGVDRKGTGHVDFDDFKRMMTPLTFSIA